MANFIRPAFAVLVGLTVSVIGHRAYAGDPPAVSAAQARPVSCDALGWMLRLDFNSVAPVICDSDRQGFLPYQEGAQVGVTKDELQHSTSLTGEGVVAAYVNVMPVPTTANWKFLGTSLGPYLQFDETYQYATPSSPSKRTEILTEGAFAQFGFGNYDAQHYFRLRGGEASSSTGTKTNSVIAEWLPTFALPGGVCALAFDLHRPYPCDGHTNTFVSYLLTPELMVQSDHYDSGPNKYRIFLTDHSALRVGPQVGLAVKPYCASESGWCGAQSVWSKLLFSATYHYSTDTLSGRRYSWVLTGFTYNALSGPLGSLGLSLSYGAGNSETSGNTTSQAKVGLTLKH